jgi:zinc-finger of transposase IS204/IS1001/IS1096/IS1165
MLPPASCPAALRLTIGLITIAADQTIVLALRSARAVVRCPLCGTAARRVHGRYERRVADLLLSVNWIGSDTECVVGRSGWRFRQTSRTHVREEGWHGWGWLAYPGSGGLNWRAARASGAGRTSPGRTSAA